MMLKTLMLAAVLVASSTPSSSQSKPVTGTCQHILQLEPTETAHFLHGYTFGIIIAAAAAGADPAGVTQLVPQRLTYGQMAHFLAAACAKNPEANALGILSTFARMNGSTASNTGLDKP